MTQSSWNRGSKVDYLITTNCVCLYVLFQYSIFYTADIGFNTDQKTSQRIRIIGHTDGSKSDLKLGSHIRMEALRPSFTASYTDVVCSLMQD